MDADLSIFQYWLLGINNTRVPVRICTNVYTRLQVVSTQGALQEKVKLALQTVKLVQRHLEESNGCYGIVYAAQLTKLKLRTAKVVCAKIALPILIPKTIALVMDVKDGKSEVTSGILQIDNSTTEVNIELVNKTQKPVNIRKGDKIATLNQVTLADMDSIDEQSLLRKFNLVQLEAEASNDELRGQTSLHTG